jgi:hypothetical protein
MHVDIRVTRLIAVVAGVIFVLATALPSCASASTSVTGTASNDFKIIVSDNAAIHADSVSLGADARTAITDTQEAENAYTACSDSTNSSCTSDLALRNTDDSLMNRILGYQRIVTGDVIQANADESDARTDVSEIDSSKYTAALKAKLLSFLNSFVKGLSESSVSASHERSSGLTAVAGVRG